PQHCGSCANDCGDYTISATTCTDNLGCGACTGDGDCAAVGSKCVDGTCGKCRGDTSGTGAACGAACVSDGQGGGGKCTNGVWCGCGAECVGGATGACLPLVCHRLTDKGICVNGICAGGGACTGPDLADLAAAGSGQLGMCSMDFERTTESDGTSLC